MLTSTVEESVFLKTADSSSSTIVILPINHIPSFKASMLTLIAVGETYGFAETAAHSDYNTRWSILNNPYYFSGPFSGLVAPAAHNFVINFMSNHSAETPGGTLDRETLKSFFAISGEPIYFPTHHP
jgi:hypothetical protein